MTNEHPNIDDIRQALATHADRIVAALMTHPVTGDLLRGVSSVEPRECAAANADRPGER